MRLIFFFGILFFVFSLIPFTSAQNVPSPQGYVLDTADVFSAEQESALEQRLSTLEQQTTVEVSVYVFPSLEGGDLFEYTQRVFDTWKIGQKGTDNGLLITISTQDREWRIHTGYGLEGTIPDGLAYQIGTKKLVPSLKEGDYFSGVSAVVNDVEGLMLNNPEVVARYKEKSFWAEPFELFGLGFAMAYVALGLLLLVLIRAWMGSKDGSKIGTFLPQLFFIIVSSLWFGVFLTMLAGFVIGGFYGFSILSLYFVYLLFFGTFPIASFASSSGRIGGFSGGGIGGFGGSGGFSGGGSFGGGMSGGGGAGGRF